MNSALQLRRSLNLLCAAVLLLLCGAVQSQAQWTNVGIPGFNSPVYYASSTADGRLHVLGWNGATSWLAYSPDRGESWDVRTIDNTFMFGVEQLDNGLLLVCGHTLLESAGYLMIGTGLDDLEGEVFNSAGTGSFGFYRVEFLNDDFGYLCGYDGAILNTTDGGGSWSRGETNSETTIFRNITIGSEQVALAAGGASFFQMTELWRTTDGGENWSILHDYGTANSITEIQMLNENTALMTGSEDGVQYIRVSQDAGQTWTQVFEDTDNANPVFFDLEIAPNGIGIAAGDAGEVAVTNDFGMTWQKLQRQTAVSLGGCAVDNNYSVYMFGSGGVGWRFDASVTGVEESPLQPGATSIVPNPLTENGRLQTSLKVEEPVVIRIYDMRGTLLRELTGQPREFAFNRDQFTPGMYVFNMLRDGRMIDSGTFTVR